MDKHERKERHSIRYRMGICVVALLLLAGGIILRLFILQVWQHDDMVARAEEQTELERRLQSPRGMILDRNGKVLAISEMSKSLYADPTMLNESPQYVAEVLAPYLRISQDEIEQCLTEDTAFVWLDRQMDHDKYEAVEAVIKAENLQGLGFRDESRRFYPNGTMAAQVIGFVGDNDRGLEGIEMILDNEIRGSKQSFRLQTDNKNTPVFASALKRILPDKERSVRLTLDSTIQYVAEKELDGIMERSRPEGASIIVMDPKSGEILAMASRPTYDLNEYSKGNKNSYKNRAVVNIYEPGSTFKPIIAAAALDSGKWHVSDVYNDTGSVNVADRIIHNWDMKGMGRVTLREIIMYSINTGMAHVAVTTGGKTLTKYAKRFGFGTITGSELPGEQEGILFDPNNMSIVDTAAMGIGQAIAVTPLQMVQAFSAIANEGHMMKPFIVKEIDNPDGSIYEKKEPTEVGQPISAG
ncbi:penicillin-binding protein 2, partial [uncultured Megasphaera sp.]|uniref:peptidoglycan D,D-transpeptidase FtsI family protein n=1 Tax=uncultured Megasphaera sp. TaxID=165188 RepID=UPI0025E2F942